MMDMIKLFKVDLAESDLFYWAFFEVFSLVLVVHFMVYGFVRQSFEQSPFLRALWENKADESVRMETKRLVVYKSILVFTHSIGKFI